MKDNTINKISTDVIVTKVCSQCKVAKKLESFYKRRSMCKKCCSLNHKKWRDKNPGRMALNSKNWRINNPEKYKEKSKKNNKSENHMKSVKKWRDKNSKRHKENLDNWRKRNPEKLAMIQRNSQLKRLYGINHNDYLKMLSTQDGKCKICERNKPDGRGKYFHVDHCHNTGKIRGLLCYWCNSALGMAEDNTETIDNAMLYLEYNYEEN